ncbi:MAG: hypothetical protein NTW25_15655 [Candidatus Kapabacteria bacterium]|nr:hypothetical protein [Candidatus Kapabacteria bacterium]
MSVNYIYNTNGQPEYAVIPIQEWESVKKLIKESTALKSNSNEFKPSDYKGILSNLNLDLDSEITEMRNQWTRNI